MSRATTTTPPAEVKSPRRTVRVTAEHIADAVKGDSSHCMIAEAIKEQVPEATKVEVDLQGIRWTDKRKGVRYVFLTPAVGQAALLMFDQGIPGLQPFNLHLRDAHIVHVRTNKRQKELSERGREVAARALEIAGPAPITEKVIEQAIAESDYDGLTVRGVKYHAGALRRGTPTAADRPTGVGKAGWRKATGTHGAKESGRVVRHGGKAQPLAVLADKPRKGRRRVFGARLAGVPTLDTGDAD